ncbi:MAG: DUF1073 domain-containing protein [Planctomycetaceae bacterium]|jgi:hypothetical protein|nr:DUF1073 domain-containing protein [Planctomycetaceae bacterium]
MEQNLPIQQDLSVQNEQLREMLVVHNNTLQALYRRAVMSGLNGEVNTSTLNRDLDAQFGYPEVINKMMYEKLFDRNAIANRVISLYPAECWLNSPKIYDQEIPSHSEFEEAVEKVFTKNYCFGFLKRIDQLSGIGNYGVLLLGVSDGRQLHEPIDGIEEDSPEELKQGEYRLLYLRAFSHGQVEISATEYRTGNSRYGQPTMYRIQFNANDHDLEGGDIDMRTLDVHWTRILHVADNRKTSEIFGMPRLQVVYNHVIDIKKILGSSGEMFYKGAYPGYAIEAVDDVTSGVQLDLESMKRQMELYENQLQRWIGLTNAHVNSLSPQAQSPKDHISAQLEQITIALACPMRIFMGSERGELASTQDAEAWNNRLMDRMRNYLSPFLVEPFVMRLIQIGALPVPRNSMFKVEWDDLNTQTESEKADVAGKWLGNISTYLSGNMELVLSLQDMLQKYAGMTEEEAKGILAKAKVEAENNPQKPVEESDVDIV